PLPLRFRRKIPAGDVYGRGGAQRADFQNRKSPIENLELNPQIAHRSMTRWLDDPMTGSALASYGLLPPAFCSTAGTHGWLSKFRLYSVKPFNNALTSIVPRCCAPVLVGWVKSPVTRRGSSSYHRAMVPMPPMAAKVLKKATPSARATRRCAATRMGMLGMVTMLPSSSRVPRSMGAMIRID